jgi:hypothetical protein
MSTSPPPPGDGVSAWMTHMRRGNLAGAWEVNDQLRRTGQVRWNVDVPRHEQQIWDGSPVDGRRVLVRCYHGLGDSIQFIRYAPTLRTRARELFVWAQPRLIPLLASVSGIDRLIPLHDGTVDADYDVDVEIMELPYLFRTTLDSIPAHVPYFHVSPEPLDTPSPRVGLVWTAGDWAPHRSIPFDLLAPLIEVPVTWYVLQGGTALGDRHDGFGIPAGTCDLVECARVMRSLDLVITVDSMPAHLAGALGTRVWTLLPADADWRWMIHRSDTPWYPTMRLFRQQQPGEWKPVIATVAAQLRRAFGPASRTRSPAARALMPQ